MRRSRRAGEREAGLGPGFRPVNARQRRYRGKGHGPSVRQGQTQIGEPCGGAADRILAAQQHLRSSIALDDDAQCPALDLGPESIGDIVELIAGVMKKPVTFRHFDAALLKHFVGGMILLLIGVMLLRPRLGAEGRQGDGQGLEVRRADLDVGPL